jgi:ABC-type amino acid transport substrate-binding protein
MTLKLAAAAALALAMAGGAADAQQAKPAPAGAPMTLDDMTAKPFTGDLDGMINRRQIRVLVPFSKTLYTVDRGVQRGIVVDTGRLLEDDLNKRLKTKHLKVYVVFVTADRDDLIPALLEGRGDIAMANLTITPQRLEKVDFAGPTRTGVSEIVVTGPGAPAIATKEDLSGQEVYVRRSSSYFSSLEALNAELAKAGRKPVVIRAAPEELERPSARPGARNGPACCAARARSASGPPARSISLGSRTSGPLHLFGLQPPVRLLSVNRI